MSFGGQERSDSGNGLSAMDCNELVELVTHTWTGALDPDTRMRFDLHLTECDGCENYLAAVPRNSSHGRQDRQR